MNDGRDSPVFVVGTPRSGTTLTAQILGRHSRIFMCGENHFFEDIYSRRRQLGELDNPRARQRILGRLSTIYQKYNQLQDQQRLDRLLSNPAVLSRLDACRDYRALLTTFMNVQLEGTGKARWGNNTPKDIFHVDQVRTLYPRAKILVCVRDVRDFLVSYRDRWTVTTEEHRQRLKDLYHPILTSLLWKSTVRRLPVLQARVGTGDLMIVRYETLVRDPESTVRAICDVLEEDYEPEMLNVETNNSSDSVRETGIFTVSVGRWRGRLKDEEVQIAQWLNRKELEKLAYPLESLPLRPGAVLRLAFSFPYALARALVANRDMRGPIIPYLTRRAGSLLPHFGEKLSWYWNRLRSMSPGEMMHRAYRGARAYGERWGRFRADVVPPASFSRSSDKGFESVCVHDPLAYSRAAAAILDGRMNLLELPEVNLGPTPRWNRNPQSGHDAPMSLGKLLDHRDEDLVGNIKYIWILNRHTHLVTLAQAYYLDGDGRWLEGVALHLRSWMDECPYPNGPNWSSSLELGIRLINWSLVWHLVGGLASPLFDGPEGLELRDRWLVTIYRHAHFIRGNFSRFSSANNHLVGEAAGLFVATVTWPFWASFEKWQRVAREELTREISRQSASDGVHREQSIFYQNFVLDFGIAAGLAGRANAVEFPRHYWDRIEAMLEYLASVMDVGGNVPMIGDSDDCPALQLSQEDTFCAHRSMLALGAVLFSRAELKVKSGRLDDKVIWLLGDEAAASFDAIEVQKTNLPNLPIRRAFREGGYFILGSDFETRDEIKLIVDAGPLGYLSLAAHGHADALAFTLSVGGNDFLIDPGTYAYRSNAKWRNYFRGTSAHNTLRVDEQDQSVIGGDFMWLQKASAKCEHWETGTAFDRFVGSHDGYMRLADPVTHRREVSFFKTKPRIRIEDAVACSGSHLIERFWHFSEHCTVSREGPSIAAERDGTRVVLDVSDDDTEIEILRGQEEPPAGWVSRRFAVRAETTTVRCHNRIEGPKALVTEVAIER